MTTTTLHAAAFDGHANQVRRLFRDGAAIDARDHRGATALHWATAYEDRHTEEVVAVLLRRGADVAARDTSGRTPEDWARERRNHRALNLFERWRRTTPERRAALRPQAGFTTVELLMSLCCLSVVMAAVYALFGMTSTAADVARTEDETTAIVQAATNAYISRASYADLTTESALAEGWLPPNLATSAGAPVNVWGGAIELGHVTLGRPDGALAITQHSVPAGACIALVSQSSGAFDTVAVNGTTAPRDAASRGAMCAASGETITLTFTAVKK